MSVTLKAKEIQRLMHNTPSPAHADAKVRAAGFMEAVEPYDLRHVQRAVSMILNAEVPDANPAFAIFPPMLVVVMRQLLDRELRHKLAFNGAVLQIMARDQDDREPPEVRRAAVAAGLARLFDPAKPVLTGAELAEKKAEDVRYLDRHDKFFHVDPIDQSDDAIRKRLLKPR